LGQWGEEGESCDGVYYEGDQLESVKTLGFEGSYEGVNAEGESEEGRSKGAVLSN
jgi:hypothetical protein